MNQSYIYLKMRRLTLLILLLFAFLANAQKYNYHALQSGGLTVKSVGTIEITASLFVVTNIYKGKSTTSDYDIVNIRNNITYISDGVSTHFFTISNDSGKKKGKKYNGILYLSIKVANFENQSLYYLTEED